jgi:hypothetical protein
MPSRFAWIDVDEASRRAMLDFIDTFRDQGTLDELGIGVIRDAFSDHFFPGTTTVQTRARYFLFVPWIFQRLEEKRTSSADLQRKLRAAELELLEAMRAAGVGEGDRMIGMVSGAALKRWPSSIYWAGLGRWGIRRFAGGQDAYRRGIDALHGRRRVTLDTDGEPAPTADNWDSDPDFPPIPPGFPAGMTLQMSRAEADYLKHRIRVSCAGSLLAMLVGKSQTLDAESIWRLPSLGEFKPELQAEIRHARWFAEVIHGATLLYYWSAAAKGNQAERARSAEGELKDWAARLKADWTDLMRWSADRAGFWANGGLRGVTVPERTRRFVDQWLDVVIQHGSSPGIWKHAAALQLIRDRERETKGEARARLWNPRQLERWDPSGEPGVLDYRWGIAGALLADIEDGLASDPSVVTRRH